MCQRIFCGLIKMLLKKREIFDSYNEAILRVSMCMNIFKHES